MVDPQDRITRQASQAEPNTNREFRNIRRDRRKRDASTRQAKCVHQQIPFPYWYVRADTAVRPYAEILESAPTIQSQRDAGWNEERVRREPTVKDVETSRNRTT